MKDEYDWLAIYLAAQSSRVISLRVLVSFLCDSLIVDVKVEKLATETLAMPSSTEPSQRSSQKKKYQDREKRIK
jgi:hypothetical protein